MESSREKKQLPERAWLRPAGRRWDIEAVFNQRRAKSRENRESGAF
jgi:hypothetical protein